eukprot:NODE_4535_length_1050_cov_100.078749_g4333_i0.p2 GENE.NODE_4535_length_1050_cov_100.078749_g4333_i0~~NODE_4535_length_1050_cov_100.078749_g4333_i0.p2  ORF type:complete len:248 (+),score=45.91 NODE_4535_length_1050_cov_100.078749_g4333_i0:79-822(+)
MSDPFASNDQEEFEHGLFDCCEDNSSRFRFFLNCCCPGFMAGDIALNVVHPPHQYCVDGLFPCNNMCLGINFIQLCCLFSVVGLGLNWIIDCIYAGKFRDEYNLEGSFVKDALLLICCKPCYATQVWRETKERSPYAQHTAAIWDEKIDKVSGGRVPKQETMGDDYDDEPVHGPGMAPRGGAPHGYPAPAPGGYAPYGPPPPPFYGMHGQHSVGKKAYLPGEGPFGPIYGPPGHQYGSASAARSQTM